QLGHRAAHAARVAEHAERHAGVVGRVHAGLLVLVQPLDHLRAPGGEIGDAGDVGDCWRLARGARRNHESESEELHRLPPGPTMNRAGARARQARVINAMKPASSRHCVPYCFAFWVLLEPDAGSARMRYLSSLVTPDSSVPPCCSTSCSSSLRGRDSAPVKQNVRPASGPAAARLTGTTPTARSRAISALRALKPSTTAFALTGPTPGSGESS